MKKSIKQKNIENYEINVSRSTSNGMKNKKIQKNRGFTLVESLFAILILTFTITGLMTIVSNSLFSARYAKDEITVSYLMQEVVDYMRNDRDTTVFVNHSNSPAPWTDFVSHYNKCTTSSKGCYFDVLKPLSKQSCNSVGICPSLYYHETPDTSISFYNYDISSTLTNFQRIIYVDTNPSGNELIVKVEVHWKNGSVSVSRTLSASFLNWRQQQ